MKYNKRSDGGIYKSSKILNVTSDNKKIAVIQNKVSMDYLPYNKIRGNVHANRQKHDEYIIPTLDTKDYDVHYNQLLFMMKPINNDDEDTSTKKYPMVRTSLNSVRYDELKGGDRTAENATVGDFFDSIIIIGQAQEAKKLELFESDKLVAVAYSGLVSILNYGGKKIRPFVKSRVTLPFIDKLDNKKISFAESRDRLLKEVFGSLNERIDLILETVDETLTGDETGDDYVIGTCVSGSESNEIPVDIVLNINQK